MDSASRLMLHQNEELIKNLDLYQLEPFLKESKIFTNSMIKDIYNSESEANLHSELPSRGPNAFSKFLEVLEKSGYKREANILRSSPKHVEKSTGKREYYSMKSKPLGTCIIINNAKFEYLENRQGSDKDAQELEILFEEMGFTVKVEHNLSGKAMKMYLKNYAKSEDLKSAHCFFLIVMSHGGKNDVVYGTDSYAIPKKEIQAVFNNVNCEYLRNKPKIFLYQACRGTLEDDGTEGVDSPKEVDPVAESSDAIIHPSHDVTDAVPIKINSSIKKDPSMSDIFIIHSSLPDHKSYRNHQQGSWLIQDMVEVFKQNYKQQDLEYMLKTVSTKVQSRLSFKGQKKQVLHTESIGFKAYLYLCSNDEYRGHDINLRKYLF